MNPSNSRNNNNFRVYLAIIICAITLLILGILNAWNTPCMGYEPDIYAETPILFWIGALSCYMVGICSILISQFYRSLPKYINIASYITMAHAALSLMSLTTIRGYGLLNISGDTGTHLGVLKTAIENGLITNSYYPGIYIEPAAFHLLTGVDAATILTIFPIFTLCLFTVGVYLVARRVLPSKGEVTLVTIVALLLPIGSTTLLRTVPMLYLGMTIADFALLPLFIYGILTCVSGRRNMLITLLIISVSTIFYHPNVTVIFLVIYAVTLIFSVLPHFGFGLVSKSSLLQITALFLSMFGMFFIWCWSFFGSTVVSGIIKIFEAANLEERGIGSSISIFQMATEYGYGIDTVFKIAGINIFIYGMLVVAGIIFICKYWKNKKYTLMKLLFIIAAAFVIVVGIAMMGDFIGNPDRFMKPIYIAALISTGFVLYQLLSWMTHKFTRTSLAKIGVIFAILAVLCFASVMTFHPSPIAFNPGYQTTQTEYTGAETLLPHIDYNKNTTGIHFNGLQRYVNAIYGSAYVVGSYAYGDYHLISTTRGSISYADSVPHHFGYDTGTSSLSDNYNDGDSIFIIDRDKKYYQAYYPEMIQYRWTPQDFKQLEMDMGLEYVYDNGGLGMYLVV